MSSQVQPDSDLDQTQTPFLDALLSFVDDEVLGFHVPGHQAGRGIVERLQPLAKVDITQVLGIDDVHRPVSACRQAQRLAAAAFGADHTYFLTNGSTVGNQAMMMATLAQGEVLLMPRNAHISSYSGLLLSGAIPAFYETRFDPEMKVYHPPELAALKAARELHPKAKALYLVSPSYYGASADVASLVRWAHAQGMLVLVDEAWGPHLAFHDDLPMSAVHAGADLTVQSTHKLGGALSQASMLHLRGVRVDRPRLEAVLRLLMSTSPYFPLLASLDAARKDLVCRGREGLDKALRLAAMARDRLAELPGLVCFGHRPEVHGWDATRVVFSAWERGLTGYEVERILRYQDGIQVEMAELYNVVLVFSGTHRPSQVDRIVDAVSQLPQGQSKTAEVALPPLPQRRMELREAFQAEHKSLPLGDAQGRVCGEFVSAYPPGLPLLLPGEVVSSQLIDYLKVELKAGVHIQGAFDTTLKTLRVVRSPHR